MKNAIQDGWWWSEEVEFCFVEKKYPIIFLIKILYFFLLKNEYYNHFFNF
jgi:hypothetical protein